MTVNRHCKTKVELGKVEGNSTKGLLQGAFNQLKKLILDLFWILKGN